MITLKEWQSLLEFVHVSDEEAPSFKKEDLGKYKSELETESDRFKIHVRHKEGRSRFITVHDKESGEHIGSISCDAKTRKILRVREMTKGSEHKGMMPEVMSHLHSNHGYSFLSSNSMTTAGHKVWEQLGKSHPIHMYNEHKNKIVKKNVTPSMKLAAKTADPSSKSDSVQSEYLLHKTKDSS